MVSIQTGQSNELDCRAPSPSEKFERRKYEKNGFFKDEAVKHDLFNTDLFLALNLPEHSDFKAIIKGI